MGQCEDEGEFQKAFMARGKGNHAKQFIKQKKPHDKRNL
jgi:hypothetical protein